MPVAWTLQLASFKDEANAKGLILETIRRSMNQISTNKISVPFEEATGGIRFDEVSLGDFVPVDKDAA